MGPSIIYQAVKFTELVVEYEDLKIFKPALPTGGWYYLGPTAVTGVTSKVGDQIGLIVKANVEDALVEVKGWKKVFVDIEGHQFSTWRGIAPEGYVVIGDFFVTGVDEPTPEQTSGIMAIRKDLISEVEPTRLIWSHRLPFANPTLWDVLVTVPIHVPTGAFVSKDGEDSLGLLIGVLKFNAVEVQKA